ELFWHFCSGLTAQVADLGLIAEGQGHTLQLLGASTEPWGTVVEPGWLSPAYGTKKAAPVGRVAARIKLPAEHGTLIVPKAVKERSTNFQLTSVQNARVYLYEDGDCQDSFVLSAQSDWTFGMFRSDASFLFCRVERGELALLVLCSARYLDFQ